MSKKFLEKLSREENMVRVMLTQSKVAKAITRAEISLQYYKYRLLPIHIDRLINIINKPPGMIMHYTHNSKKYTLANALTYNYKSSFSEGSSLRTNISHRLDKNSCGTMIVAIDGIINSLTIKKRIMERKIKKHYLALIQSKPACKYGYIISDFNDKIAITQYKVIKTFNKGQYSLLECVIKTGRTNQIRIHMNNIKCNIIGETKYTIKSRVSYLYIYSHYLGAGKSLRRYFLCAYKVLFSTLLGTALPLENNIQSFINIMKEDL